MARGTVAPSLLVLGGGAKGLLPAQGMEGEEIESSQAETRREWSSLGGGDADRREAQQPRASGSEPGTGGFSRGDEKVCGTRNATEGFWKLQPGHEPKKAAGASVHPAGLIHHSSCTLFHLRQTNPTSQDIVQDEPHVLWRHRRSFPEELLPALGPPQPSGTSLVALRSQGNNA